MRSRALAGVLGLALGLGGGCATRSQPYRFASPLLGAADVPTAPLPGAKPSTEERRSPTKRSPRVAARHAAPIRVSGWQADAQQGVIREVSARGIEARMPVASAEAADAVARDGRARAVVWSRLPAPHRKSSLPVQLVPLIREPTDLRALVGQRDKRDPFAIVLGWLDDIGIQSAPYPVHGRTLVTWAETARKLAPPTEIPRPGDLLVFDRAVSDEPADLIALVIALDARGVIEIVYPGGGVIRRGFLDPTRPSIRRDADGAVVNTFMRHVKRMPPAGTRYLAGELVAHIIRTR